MLPTSFTVPTAPQESAVPTWAWNCTQCADIRRVPRVLNTIPYGNLLVFSVPLAQLASDTFLYSHCLWGTEPELTAKLIILLFGGAIRVEICWTNEASFHQLGNKYSKLKKKMDTPYFFHVIQQTNKGNKLVPGADDWWTNAPQRP